MKTDSHYVVWKGELRWVADKEVSPGIKNGNEEYIAGVVGWPRGTWFRERRRVLALEEWTL